MIWDSRHEGVTPVPVQLQANQFPAHCLSLTTQLGGKSVVTSLYLHFFPNLLYNSIHRFDRERYACFRLIYK